jgi:rifampicin phosphotransferase
MSTATVRRLGDVRLADAAEVGGKAASLGELLASGVRVPNGVVVTADAVEMSADDRRTLLRAGAAELGVGPFAVRSSGIAEDGVERSFAGMFESVLDVSGDELSAAVEKCLASAGALRVGEYAGDGDRRMAVIIQRMVAPTAAGVALTADPITGDRGSCVVTAVRGTGDRLVSGEAFGDEWTVRGKEVSVRRQPERAIDRRQALHVASEASRIADDRGTPQDIEWAIDGDGTLWILQARPMTALPPDVSWDAPTRGAYTRSVRFGEWIAEPVTPLFESWLLTAMEDRLHRQLLKWLGQRAPRPFHVVVNGWYFYSINWLSGGTFLRSLPGILVRLVRWPKRVAGVIPQTVRHSVPIFEREWREEVRPRYRAAVADAEARVETLPVAELPSLIDGLADQAGHVFSSIAALSGAAYKTEVNLARFYRRHLGQLGGSHLPLVAGFQPPTDPDRHAVASLDWWHATSPTPASASTSAEDHARLIGIRKAAEAAAFDALAPSPRRLRTFRRLLVEAQHMVPLREEQVREWTLAWPVMRRAVLRIGEALVSRSALASADDVFFLTRDEATSTLDDARSVERVDVSARRALREEQARLVAPLAVGRWNLVLRRMWASFPRYLGAVPSELAIVTGTPASPGRATGAVRVIRGAEDFDALQPGEILVAPLTAPAWTPLFTRAAAVVTDVGSAAAHASIIAREYGIPAVVGCGEATSRLADGMRVTVDGDTGNVEPA